MALKNQKWFCHIYVLLLINLKAKSNYSQFPKAQNLKDYREKIQHYLDNIAHTLKEEGMNVKTLVTGSGPARTILAVGEDENIDLIMMSSHGRGGAKRSDQIVIGSVAEKVVEKTLCPVFLLPLHREDMIGIQSTDDFDHHHSESEEE